MSAAAAPIRAIGYVRVSTAGQADEGASLEAQKQKLAGEAERRGWSIDITSDTSSAKRERRRPSFELALERLDRGEYDALIVSRLDRAWRSVGHFAETLDRADKKGWLIVLLDPAVDMTTPYGRAMAGVAAVFAQLERELIAQRTREGMAEKARTGTWKNGRGPGRERQVCDEAIRYVKRAAARGHLQKRIAEDLEQLGIPAPNGRWSQQLVSRIIRNY